MGAARRLLDASWRHAVPLAYRHESNATFIRSVHSFLQQFGLSSLANADFGKCYGSVESSVEDCGRDWRSGSDSSSGVVSSEVFSSAYRDGGFFLGRSGNRLLWRSDRFDDGARLPGIVLQTRGLAAKAKKAKSKVEQPESTEDTAATAKTNAVKMMETALDVLCREHSKLRTGRASAGMLDHITVEAHGVRTPLNHIAAVTVSGLQTLNVLPYDASMVKEVEKAILNSPMGLNPQVDGATMTVPLPRLTKEHCETMCKLVGKAGESAKLTIRRARKEALDMVKASGDLSKDEMKRFEKEVEDLTKKYTKTIDDTCKNKENEIMA
ncbi:unnamed protein product [Calypogeia fissa]